MTRFAVLFLTLLAWAGVTASAEAQPEQAPISAESLLADEFARAALTVLALPQSGEDGHPMTLAAILLDEALALDPENPQLWMFRKELAETMGDPDALESALVGYLATGVRDDKAQLDLVMLRVGAHQTLDEQYRAIEQLLESEGARRLSDPLRSRLASFAASLAEELVDPAAQARWVVEAARLDPANVEAAVMLRDLVVARGGDALRRGTATLNVVRAGPMDPDARLELAGLLASEAAFERALQQYQLVDNWIGSSPVIVGEMVFRELLPIEDTRQWLQALAVTGNDPLLLQVVEGHEEYFGAYAEARSKIEDPGEGAELPPEQPAHLPWEFELLRLAVLDGPSDGDAAGASLGRLAEALERGDDGLTAGRLAVWAAVFGPDTEQAQALAGALDDDDTDKALAQGWLAARRGEAEQARSLLGSLAEADPLAACGLVLVDDLDDAGRARALQEIVHRDPTGWGGVAAGRRLSRDGRDLPPTRVGQALIDRMTRFPEALWLVDLNRTPWLDARLRITPSRFNHLEPISAELTIWNTSRFPIAIGEAEVIRSRAVLQVSASVNGQALPPLSPIVVDIGRKLTLDAGERLIIDTRLDYHQFGALRALNPSSGVLFDTRLILNPAVGPTGVLIPAATGGVSTVRDCIVQGAPPNAEQIEGWAQQLDSGSDRDRDRYRAIARLAGLSRDQLPELITPELEAQVRGQMSEAYDGWGENDRAWAVMFMLNAEEAGSTYGLMIGELIRASDSERLWLAYLARQVKDPESTMLSDAVRRQDLARVARFAETYRRALREAVAEQERMQLEFEEQQRLREQQLREQEGAQP